MNKPIGGRGNKAPYGTKIVRVPEPVLERVREIVESYRDGIDSEFSATAAHDTKPVTGYDLIRDEVDEWRKSAKVGKDRLEKLLQLVYGADFSL
jgi:hypothetical protein